MPLDDFNVPGAEGPDNALTITHNGDQFEVSGELDFELGDLPGGEGLPNIDELLASSEPELSIALTFPGEVTSSNGSIDGCTVTWEPSLTEPTSFEATADDSGGCTESIKWWAWILIGLGVLVVIGGIVAIVRTIKKEKSRALVAAGRTGHRGRIRRRRHGSLDRRPAARVDAAHDAAARTADAIRTADDTRSRPRPTSRHRRRRRPTPGRSPTCPGRRPTRATPSTAVRSPTCRTCPGRRRTPGRSPPPPPSGPAGFPPPEPKD